MRPLVRNRWLLLAIALALLAVASVTAAFIRTRSNGCLFDDGVAYCRMALGKLAYPPWSRRVLVPAVVSWLPAGWSVVLRFKLIALVASSGATIGTGLLALRLIRDRATPRVAYACAVAAAALVALAPHYFRMALTAPVYVDQVAIFLGVVWCLLVTARARSLRSVSPLVVLLLIPTREAWVLPLLLAAGVLWWMRDRVLAAATLAAILIGAAFTFTRPSASGGAWSHYSGLIQVLHDGRMTLTHPDHALWGVFFGVGFVAFLAVLLFARWRRLRGPVGIVLAIACGHVLQAPLAGTDVCRYAAEAVPFAVVASLLAAIEAGSSRATWALGALTAATVLLWQPFRTPAPGAKAFQSMYTPGNSSVFIAIGGVILIVTTLIWTLRGPSAMPRSADSRPVDQTRLAKGILRDA